MSKSNPTAKLKFLSLALACLVLNAPLTAFAQIARTHKFDTPLLAGKTTFCSPTAAVQAIVVNGEKQREAKSEDIEVIREGGTSLVVVKIGDALCPGDTLKTKAGDQITLWFYREPVGTENLVYLDHDTEVVIGSICLRSGWLLAQVGVNFSVCVDNTTLGVKKTEFEVSSTADEPLKVAVFKGEVQVTQTEPQAELASEPKESPNQIPKTDLVKAPVVVGEKEQLTIKSDKTGNPVEVRPISAEDGKSRINYWSAKIITASQPAKNEKANLNYTDAERSDAFVEARFKSLWQGDATAFKNLGQVYNDWEMGGKAKEQLLIAERKDKGLEETADFQANLGEAYRLSGNYIMAETHLKKALDLKPEYPFAYYSRGKALVERYEKEGTNKALLDDARKYLLRSIQDGSYGPPVNKKMSETEMDRVIKQRGELFLLNQNKWVTDEKWWCEKNKPEGTTYTGKLNLPGLKAVGLNVSGPATIFIIGDQFKLVSGSQILTGNIVGNTTGSYTAVNLRFDDPRIAQVSQETLGLSFRETGNCDQLVFKPSTDTTSGTVQMAVIKP